MTHPLCSFGFRYMELLTFIFAIALLNGLTRNLAKGG